jgi:hypothetical protein
MEYANLIVDAIDPDSIFIDGVLHRDHCLQT